MPDTIDGILRLPAVLNCTGLSRSTLYRKMRDGSFPKQIAISTRCAGWRESAVLEWLKNPIYYTSEDNAKCQTGSESAAWSPKRMLGSMGRR